MKIKNKKNNANYVNYKLGGFAKKALIPSGKVVDVLDILDVTQIINYGDFDRGFFEIVKEESVIAESTKSKNNKNKVEDSLEKVKKEVKNYTEKE